MRTLRQTISTADLIKGWELSQVIEFRDTLQEVINDMTDEEKENSLSYYLRTKNNLFIAEEELIRRAL